MADQQILSPFHAQTHTHTHTHTLTLLLTAGFNPKTRLQIGEWSRSIGLDYAQDGPGAAYVTCGLGYLDAMAPANSGGAHAVGSAMLYSVQKVWDGTANDPTSSPDLNAATVFNWWARMVGAQHVSTAGSRQPYPIGPDPSSKDELCVFAARHQPGRGGTRLPGDAAGERSGGATDEVLAIIAHYQAVDTTTKPKTGPCFDLTVQLRGVPYARWTWTQYANDVDKKLPAVAWGHGSGPTASLALQMHGNSYSTLAIAPSTGLGGARHRSELPEGARSDGYPLGVRYDAATRRAVAQQACAPAPPGPGL